MNATVQEASAYQALRPFLLITLGQMFSLLGTSTVAFVLSVWVYEQTLSATRVALVMMAMLLPVVLLLPAAGVLVDRLGPRRVLLLSDVWLLPSTALLGLAVLAGGGWPLYLALAVAATGSAGRFAALQALSTSLVPPRQHAHAGALIQLAQALPATVAPLVGAWALPYTGIAPMLLLRAVTSLVAIAVVLSMPEPAAAPAEPPARTGFWDDIGHGWASITSQRGLTYLLLLDAGSAFAFGFLQVLLTPLLLSFATPKALGLTLAIGGCGLLTGGLLATVCPDPPRRLEGVLSVSVLQGLALLLFVLPSSLPLLATCLFCYHMAGPMKAGCNQALWQANLPADSQGRVFALTQFVGLGTVLLAASAAGPLADHVFEPLLAGPGPLAARLGPVLGVGPGRGIALLLAVLGMLMLLSSLAARGIPSLWRLADPHD